MQIEGNLFLNRATPGRHATGSWQLGVPVSLVLNVQADEIFLQIGVEGPWKSPWSSRLVTTERLGHARVSDLPFVQPDGKPYRLDTDYLGHGRESGNPFPGPFAEPSEGSAYSIKVWPLAGPLEGPGS